MGDKQRDLGHKILILMRHAKSSWKEPLNDHDRPLNRRGKRAAKLIGETLAAKGFIPDLILSSDAKRARSSAKRLLKGLGGKGVSKIELDPMLYEADAATIMREISKTPSHIQTLLLIAHNPGISDLAAMLSGDNSLSWLPTAGTVIFEFNVDSWKDLPLAEAKPLLRLFPRELEER